MKALRWIIGVFLISVAVVILAQVIIPGDRHELWVYLNPLMAVSIVLVIAFCIWNRVRSSDDAEASRSSQGFPEYEIVLFGSLFIAYLFFFNWVTELNEGEGYGWVWIILNGMIPVLNIWAGSRLLTRE